MDDLSASRDSPNRSSSAKKTRYTILTISGISPAMRRVRSCRSHWSEKWKSTKKAPCIRKALFVYKAPDFRPGPLECCLPFRASLCAMGYIGFETTPRFPGNHSRWRHQLRPGGNSSLLRGWPRYQRLWSPGHDASIPACEPRLPAPYERSNQE